MRLPTFFRAPLAVGAVLLLATACADEDQNQAAPASPQTITISQEALYPEGVQYDPAQARFLVSSVRRGTIGQVKDDGSYAVFNDDAQLISTIGLHLDAGRNRLLAAVSDPGKEASVRSTTATAGKRAALAIFDTRGTGPGPLSRFVDLGALRPTAAHFANDIAVDAQGNIYVTDSYSPIIYKVDLQDKATVFYENAALATPPGQFGFNGIVFHPEGYLLAVHSTLGRLYKITIPVAVGAGSPAAPTATAVATPQGLSLGGGDGLLLQNNQTLLLVANSQRTVFRLSSNNSWASTTVGGTFATGDTFPTTLTRRGAADVYVLYAYLSKLFGGVMPPQSTFTINKVKF